MTGQPASSRSRCRSSIVGAGVALISAIVVFALAWQRYGHTQWHHYIGPKNPNCFGFAFALDYPDGWQPVVPPNMPDFILLKPIPLSGPARWWHDYVLRQHDGNTGEVRIECTITPLSIGTMPPAEYFMILEKASRANQIFGWHVTLHRFDHALGPALEATGSFGPTPARQRRAPNLRRYIRRNLMTFLRERPQGWPILVTITAIMPGDAYPRNRAMLDAIFQHVRVVKER